jgi:hypothetical protein
MSKIRVYELAKMLGKTNREMMDLLRDLGVEVKNHMSSIESETAQLVEDAVSEGRKGLAATAFLPERWSSPKGLLSMRWRSIWGRNPGNWSRSWSLQAT